MSWFGLYPPDDNPFSAANRRKYLNRRKAAMGAPSEPRGRKWVTPKNNYRRIKALEKKQEFKFVDLSFTGTTAVAGNLLHFTQINDGDTEQERNGEKITLRSISFKMKLTPITDGGQCLVRACVFVDWYGRTTPTLNTVAATDLITSGGTPIIQHFNQDNRSRYTVLYDKVFVFNQCQASNDGTNPVTGMSCPAFDKFYKKKKFNIHYSGATGTDIGKGQVYMFLWTDAGSNHPTFAVDTRCYFNDM